MSEYFNVRILQMSIVSDGHKYCHRNDHVASDEVEITLTRNAVAWESYKNHTLGMNTTHSVSVAASQIRVATKA